MFCPYVFAIFDSELTGDLVARGGGDLGLALGVVARWLILEFNFGHHSGINKVVATMAYCNKVSPASPYFVNVFGVDEEPVRVCVGFF